jgi:hypothetical protein
MTDLSREPEPIRCSECHREVDEFTAIKERWGYWSDGCGELLPFCPECARREFAPDAPASGLTGATGSTHDRRMHVVEPAVRQAYDRPNFVKGEGHG